MHLFLCHVVTVSVTHYMQGDFFFFFFFFFLCESLYTHILLPAVCAQVGGFTVEKNKTRNVIL